MYKKQIARGIKLLDYHFEGSKWLNKVKLPTLNMQTMDYCLLGQVFGGYTSGTIELMVGVGWTYGFSIQDEGIFEPSIKYDTLTREWKDAIKKHRKVCDNRSAVKHGSLALLSKS